LVIGTKSYKIASSVITQVLGRIKEMHDAKVGEIQCFMMFMVVDTNSYNLLLGLGFLIKI
jgi:hypothetical protein